MEQDLRPLGVSSNNIHENQPALMSDGRQNCSWLSEAIVDDKFRSLSGSATNWEYRKYLTANANNVMSNNMKNNENHTYVHMHNLAYKLYTAHG